MGRNPLEPTGQDHELFIFTGLGDRKEKSLGNKKQRVVCGIIVAILVAMSVCFILANWSKKTSQAKVNSVCFTTGETELIITEQGGFKIQKCRNGDTLTTTISTKEIEGINREYENALSKGYLKQLIAKAPRKIGAPAWMQSMIDYAWKKATGRGLSHDLAVQFILIVEAESEWIVDADNTNTNGSTDHGLCQMNSTFHKEFIESESFNYWDLQIERCLDIYQDALKKNKLDTRFYGVSRIEEVKNRFEFES